MAKKHLDKKFIDRLMAPAEGQRLIYDDAVTGLGIRITSAGHKSFIFNYRLGHRVRRLTIGEYGNPTKGKMTVVMARKKAGEYRRKVEDGQDPLAKRDASDMGKLCDIFIEDHLPKLRPSTQTEYRAIIDTYIRPALRFTKVADITHNDVDTLHRHVSKGTKKKKGAPYRANRMVAVLSKMMSFAIKKGWRADNPASGIEKNHEPKRQKYLTSKELVRLAEVLASFPDQQAANIIRMLLLTGCRRGEAQSARWDQFDLVVGVWTKPGATTKQKTEHRVPLSAPAMQLLVDLKHEAGKGATFVFPSDSATGYRVAISKAWAKIRKLAKIEDARLHDLRHTYASLLASSGSTLPMIGGLLGHTQPATTARYAHLQDEPLRRATETVGSIIAGKKSAEVVPLKRGA